MADGLPESRAGSGNSPTTASKSQTHNSTQTRKYDHYIMWPLIAAWRLLILIRDFLDKHSAIINALATVAIVALTFVYVKYSKKQWETMKESNGITRDAMVAAQRPWLKIKHRIIKPLTFDVGGKVAGPIASMVLEDTIENVGQSVAVNVLSWEDIIPLDPDSSARTASARQKEWCNANRHPNPNGVTGYGLFPHDPAIGQSFIGPTMDKVMEAVSHNPDYLRGKVGFALVGCVCYRASFEPKSSPTHQTRFLYYLGEPNEGGVIQPYILPQGIASKLRLIMMPDGFTAD